jgi:Protein of unknown function (DUF3048) N-terminal domain/Protein of unknown function (DUF3048) C-terminal domain
MRSYLNKGSIALAVIVALAAPAGCGGGGKHAADKPAAVKIASKPKPKPKPTAPLSGTPDLLLAANHRCAITVKIENTPASRPKYGVEQADVVYEEVVEAGITRLAAIFNSQAPERVGPVRSVRKTDQSLVWPIGGVFAYSGGAPYAIASINTAPVVQLDETRAGSLMFRDHSRYAPHNLYAHLDQMYAKCGKPVPPPALFTYRDTHSKLFGVPTSSVRVGFLGDPSFAVTWTWDAPSGTWKRSIFGSSENVATGAQLAPTNVVVMFVSYVGGDPNHDGFGAEAMLTGTGKALVFSSGREIVGTWSRPDKVKPAQLLDAAGRVIALNPGQTWVELPDAGYSVTKTP